MSNDSAESPQRAIRRMVSTVETIQYLFPDLWVSADSNPQETLLNGETEQHKLDVHVQQPYTAVSVKQSNQRDDSWPYARMKNDTAPESSHKAMSRIMSTVPANHLLFPELWNPIDKVSQNVLPEVAYEPASISSNLNHRQHIQLPIKQRDIQESFARLELMDPSEDGDSSDSGFY